LEKQKKEYFSHDLYARYDRRIASLVKDYKAEGYGIFWTIVEMIHEEGGSLDNDELTVYAVAKDMCAEVALVQLIISKCINIYKLFLLEDGKLTSLRAQRNLNFRKATKESASIAGKASAEARKKVKDAIKSVEEKEKNEGEKVSTPVQHSFNTRSTGVQRNPTKERKVKERKVKESLFRKKNDEKNENEKNPAKTAENPEKTLGDLESYVVRDAEQTILSHRAIFESILMKTSTSQEAGLAELHTYHLHLDELERYPMGRKAVFSGFEKWLLNGKKIFKNNSNAKSTGAASTLGKEMEFDQP
jgi:uncharacterized protein (DUF302 family)